MERVLVHRRYLLNNVGTHLQLSILRQIGVNEIAYWSKLQKRNMHSVGIEPTTLESRVQHPNH